MSLPKWQHINLMLFFAAGCTRSLVGSAGLLVCFFSNIETVFGKEEAVASFPIIMCELYEGRVTASNVQTALKELDIIESIFKSSKSSELVMPEILTHGDIAYFGEINENASNLLQCFRTNDGQLLTMRLRSAFNEALFFNVDIIIQDLLGTEL